MNYTPIFTTYNSTQHRITREGSTPKLRSSTTIYDTTNILTPQFLQHIYYTKQGEIQTSTNTYELFPNRQRYHLHHNGKRYTSAEQKSPAHHTQITTNSQDHENNNSYYTQISQVSIQIFRATVPYNIREHILHSHTTLHPRTQ